jgi:hypothetical protein
VKQQFQYYKLLGDKTIARVDEAQFFHVLHPEANSMAIIMRHMAGNMLSRWTDFLTSDGEKEWRQRDAEFENNRVSKQELVAYWEKGWECLFQALDSVTTSDLERIIYIRNQGHTVVEAINRQLAHYPYHIGQMVFLAKMLTDHWESLSIPRGNSSQFNLEKFSQPAHKEHFTQEMLNQQTSMDRKK